MIDYLLTNIKLNSFRVNVCMLAQLNGGDDDDATHEGAARTNKGFGGAPATGNQQTVHSGRNRTRCKAY